MSDKKVSISTPINISGKLSEIGAAIPAGISAAFRRYWNYTVKVARDFNKHLIHNHEKEFIKAVEKDFERRGH